MKCVLYKGKLLGSTSQSAAWCGPSYQAVREPPAAGSHGRPSCLPSPPSAGGQPGPWPALSPLAQATAAHRTQAGHCPPAPPPQRRRTLSGGPGPQCSRHNAFPSQRAMWQRWTGHPWTLGLHRNESGGHSATLQAPAMRAEPVRAAAASPDAW